MYNPVNVLEWRMIRFVFKQTKQCKVNVSLKSQSGEWTSQEKNNKKKVSPIYTLVYNILLINLVILPLV